MLLPVPAPSSLHSLLFALFALLLFPLTTTTTTTTTSIQHLTLRVPPSLPPLPPSTRAILKTRNHTLRAPVTRRNSFVFAWGDLVQPFNRKEEGEGKVVSYLLDIACRDYDFAAYGVDVFLPSIPVGEGTEEGRTEIYRVQRGGIEVGGREVLEVKPDGEGEGMGVGLDVEVKVLRGREFYEKRAGFSPLDLLKNPMILIAVVGLAFVFGMPYLMDSMDPEMKKEFEEQQKKSILSGGASTANPLQNFDMAAWMAGKTTGSASASGEQTADEGSGNGSGSGGRLRRRG